MGEGREVVKRGGGVKREKGALRAAQADNSSRDQRESSAGKAEVATKLPCTHIPHATCSMHSQLAVKQLPPPTPLSFANKLLYLCFWVTLRQFESELLRCWLECKSKCKGARGAVTTLAANTESKGERNRERERGAERGEGGGRQSSALGYGTQQFLLLCAFVGAAFMQICSCCQVQFQCVCVCVLVYKCICVCVCVRSLPVCVCVCPLLCTLFSKGIFNVFKQLLFAA